ncbi:hypothetical protein BKI52_34610 [marine bacterium AO1-C]|nr:hypothetical protein BKI52_34610 [marine bacterium AO1-C]
MLNKSKMRKLIMISLILLTITQAYADNINIFKADVEEKKVVLRWMTKEIRAQYFVVEKSTNGIYFKNVKKVNPLHDIGKLYKTYDHQLMGNQVVYYRIKQVIDENNCIYSSIIPLRYQIPSLKIDVYPKLLMHGNVHVWLNDLHSRRVKIYALSPDHKILYNKFFNTRYKSSHYVEIPRKYLNSKAVKLFIVTDQGMKREEITIK